MHDAPRVLIAGDSYSDPWWQGTGENWVTWLSNVYPVKCVAQAGFSNWDIAQTLKRTSADIIICSLTSWSRISQHPSVRHLADNQSEWNWMVDNLNGIDESIQWTRTRTVTPIRAKNKLITEQLVETYPHVYFWSCFPDYDNIPEVSTLYLEHENELYSKIIPTGCHLSRTGNEQMLKHMRSVIEQWDT